MHRVLPFAAMRWKAENLAPCPEPSPSSAASKTTSH